MSRDPSAIAIKNGQFFGLEVKPSEAEIVIVSAPGEVTSLYREGTRGGPDAWLVASYQLDFHTPFLEKAWKMKLATVAPNPAWRKDAEKWRALAKGYIEFLEGGGDPETNLDWKRSLEELNLASEKFHHSVEREVAHWLEQGKRVALVGGDHSVSWGAIRAHARRQPISILHFDAHADLRIAYEGFEHSHASIMNHFYRFDGVQALVQVGIRDVSPQELSIIAENPDRISTFFDWDLQKRLMKGEAWAKIAEDIVSKLSERVYVSFDIDGLDPRFCPSTGTPVPGGLDFSQALFVMDQVRRSGREIVGLDLVEVAPHPTDESNQWDGNVGARLLFHMCAMMASTKR